MTDAELIAKKLAEIETYLADLQRLGRPDLLETDLKEQRFLLMTLQPASSTLLAARGGSRAAFDRRCIAPNIVAPQSKMARYTPSSRLVGRAPRRSRCYTDFHHGLLGIVLRRVRPLKLGHGCGFGIVVP